jgi:hypothetical protein
VNTEKTRSSPNIMISIAPTSATTTAPVSSPRCWCPCAARNPAAPTAVSSTAPHSESRTARDGRRRCRYRTPTNRSNR